MVLIGWIGAILLALCGLPQAFKTFRTKSCNDLSWLFLGAWLLGEILVLVYIIWDNYETYDFQWPLWLNYILNIIITSYLLLAKWTYNGRT
jgi:uncharacterized protein with PQ loop repeat